MPMFTRDEAAAIMRRQGWTEDRIRAAIAREYGEPLQRATVQAERLYRPAVSSEGAIARDPNAVEADEQNEIRKRAVAHGFVWRSTSTVRRSRIFPGCPDLILIHRVLPLWTWWETKRQVGGELSPDQIDFRDDCLRTGQPWHAGDRYDFDAWLLETGVSIRQGEQLVPARPWIQIAQDEEAKSA